MTCHACGAENPATNRFCGGCGGALARACAACAHLNAPDHRFCGACGASLGAHPEPTRGRVEASDRRPETPEVRKVVTVVFADLIGSTALHERLDAESVRGFMDHYYQAMRAAVEAHGGAVTQLLGDGVKAVFGAPRVAEDDAICAVRAAVAMQRAFHELAREQLGTVGKTGLRVAVNTGEVVASEGTEIIGDPVNVAARLQEAGQDGEVVIGESTRRLVGALLTLAPLGNLALKGRSETVAAYRVVSLERPAGASAVAFVGRDDEMQRLAAVYDAALAAPAARLAVILGSPGLGKSRLLDEFARRLDGVTVLTAHCEAAGGATFAPIARALRAGLRVGATGGYELRTAIDAAVPGGDADRGRIAAGIGALLAGTPAAPEETFFVVRRLLAGLAAAQPVVLAIDDLQWAEPLLLDLIEHLVQWSTGVPLLLLAAARPELRDARSSLASTGRLVTDVVTLGGLDAAAATRLAASVIGADALPAAVAGRVLATSEGNPLFVGELVRMLVDDGALRREGDRWTAGVDLAALEMPPTIHALLAARIERLRAEDRLVLERAAIVGRQFSRAGIAHLLPHEAQGDLDARLEALRRSELIEPDATWFLGEPALRFHHGLTRDAAYRRVLKGTRAELHGRFADWIESRVAGVEGAVEHDETIGWHLEQAHQHLRELGPIDARGRALGDRAARYLAAAGRRALGRDDLPVAANLLGRALDQLDPADAARADLALDWCEALLAAGDVGPAAQALDELGRFTDGSDRLLAWHTCFAGELAALTDPQTLRATADAVAAAAATLAAAGDGAGEAKAHSVHALALARLGKVGACEAALDKALAAARRAHDRRRSNAVLAGAPLAALWGPSPVTRASGRCLDVVRVLRITQGAPAVEGVALRCQAVLEALRGRREAARRMLASARRMVEELGITQQLLETDVAAGFIDLLEGDAAAAERCLRGAYDGLRSHGLRIDAARAAAFLGRALLIQGRATEAEALSRDSETLAGDDLEAAITWRGVRAEALARRGMHAEAVDFARAAVDIAAATDALLHHAGARLALAAALRATGRPDEADAEERRAIELWGAKGATVLVERVRPDVRHVGAVDGQPHDRAEPMSRIRHRVRPNAAIANAIRFETAVAARDVDAIAAHLGESGEVLDHTTGATYARQASLATWLALLTAQDGAYRLEPLAALGDSLTLCRQWASASGAAGAKFDVGAFEIENVLLVEVDAQGQRRSTEIFAADRLGTAVARLYERHAELLPDGPARDRAGATARSVATCAEPIDLNLSALAIARDIEFIDHRTVGLGPVGAQGLRKALLALSDLSEDLTNSLHDVLALHSDALLVYWTSSGRDRTSGGTFERSFLLLWAFGADGLVARFDQFDVGHEAEALARFDELTAEPPTVASRAAERRQRRVRENAATAQAARLEQAIAARNHDALSDSWVEEFEAVDHTTGAVFGRRGVTSTWRSLLAAQDPFCRYEPLATLGASLALLRFSRSGSEITFGKFDVGAFEVTEVHLLEGDAHGRLRHAEIFAADRLGDAVARLYERYAELLPDGPARDRAAATARSVAAMLDPPDVDRYAAGLAPAAEYVDHRTLGLGSARGAEEILRGTWALLEVAENLTTRIDDVLDLRSDALLVHRTNFGTDRAGGGAYERPFLLLLVFGADGLVSRWEQFDEDGNAEALARFAALVPNPAEGLAADPGAAQTHQRRVRANAATANAARMEAVVAARDSDAFAALLADDARVVSHPTGAEWGLEGALSTWRSAMKAQDLTFRLEPLATLGDRLALCREALSGSGATGKKFDVGPYEREDFVVIEVDAQGKRRLTETFAIDRLGGAVVRLYERYANFLPDGSEGDRAAATARSVAAFLGPFDLERYAAAVAPAVEGIDHQTIGTWSSHGAEAFLRQIGSLLDVADDIATRLDDVLALRSDALLMRMATAGTDRASGGAFERPYITLWVFGADGLASRCEYFDFERDAAALARFDALTAEPATTRRTDRALPADGAAPASPVQRRVRANAATVQLASEAAAIAAGDADAIPDLFADESEVVDHTTGIVFDRQGVLGTWRAFLKAESPTMAHEPLATLGDSLAINRVSSSASGFAGRTFDVGAYERVEIGLVEVDANGRRRRSELFAADRLGGAVARLYERYAELLPDGAERERADATARSVAALLDRPDLDRYGAALAPAVEFVDHRILGFGSARGAGAILQNIHAMLELEENVSTRIDDIIDLRSDGLLVHRTGFGRGRASGGTYERPFLQLLAFGSDGLVSRWDMFDVDRDAEALARFDELVPSPAEGLMAEPAVRHLAALPAPAADTYQRRVQANAETANAARVRAAIAARDTAAIAPLIAHECEIVDHTTGVVYDGQGWLSTLRAFFKAEDPALTTDTLATLGDSLALYREKTSARGFVGRTFDVGAYEKVETVLSEVDAQGRRRRRELFRADRLGDAVVRLYERYAELLPDAADRDRIAATARAVSAHVGPLDLDRLVSAMALAVEFLDHRIVGIGSVHGVQAFRAALRTLFEVADDVTNRADDVLGLRPGALLLRVTNFGTDHAGGGPYERPYLMLWVFGADGLVTHLEQFDVDRDAEALARFDELCPSEACPGPVPSPVDGTSRKVEWLLTEPAVAARITNAATRAWDRFTNAWEARDWQGVAATFAPGFRMLDRRKMMLMELDRGGHLESLRLGFEMRSSRFTLQSLATRGDRLALLRLRVELSGANVGPSEVDCLQVSEVDSGGDFVVMVALDPDDLDAAYAELDERYAAGEAAPYVRSLETYQHVGRAAAAGDWERLAGLLAPDFVLQDHRALGWGTLRSRADYVASVRALLALRPDAALRMDHVLAFDDRRSLVVSGWVGGEAEGAFDMPAVAVSVFGPEGIRRVDLYNLDRLDAAWARFAELRPEGSASVSSDPNTAEGTP